MATITEDYIKSLPPIYRDIMGAFAELEPTRKSGYGLAFQTFYAHLNSKYSIAEIKQACEQMREGGAVKIENQIFVYPTAVGEKIIEAITGKEAETPVTVTPFPKPPG